MEREKKVEDELHSFPSYLKSRSDCRTLTKRKLQQIIGRITPELETYDNEVQMLRDLNLLAFLHHELGDKHEALKYITESLSKKPRNINALVLKSWFSLKSSDIYESEKVLTDIKTVYDDHIEVIHAKAELAYIYTRLGVKFYDKAENTFKELFDEIEKEKEKVTVDPNVIFIWKFGLTLIRKRTLNFNNLTEENKFDITIERISQVFKDYSELESIHQIDNTSRARLMVEMGELVKSANLKMPKRLYHDRSKMKIFKRQATYYFEKALTYSDSDPFVLNRCGKHYKYNDFTVHKSVGLLEKSVSIRETSFAHHHLALSLKRKLEINLRSNKLPKGDEQQHDVQNTSSTHVRNLWTSPQDTRDSKNRNNTSAAKGQNPKARTDDVIVNHPGMLQCGNTVNTETIHQQATARRTMESSSSSLGALGGMDGTTSNTVVGVERSWSAGNTRHLGNEPYADFTSGFERMNLYPRRRGSYSALMRNQPQPRGRSAGRRDMTYMSNVGSNDRYARPFNSYQGYGRQPRGQNKRFTDDRSQPRGRSAAMASMSNVGSNVRYTRSFNSYQGCGRRRQGQYKRFTGDRSGERDKTRITKKIIKSPSKIKYLDGSDAGSIDKILEHLDRAFDMSENMSALYDKGLTLRALRRYDEAIDAFKLFFGNVSSPSLVLLANAYDQSAFCLMDKLEGLQESETTKKMNYNLKHYLHASIEICYKRIMPKYQDLKYCWSSPVILEEMLQKKDRTKDNLSELHELHELYSKIQMYSKDNKLLTELLELEENNDNRNVLYIEKIRNHCKLQNYDDAILTSSLMGDQMNDQPLFLEIHIEGGFQSYIKNENELAKLRFKSSLDKCLDIQADVEVDNEDIFQVFILCSETNEDSPQCLKIGLEKLGLDVTVNFENLLNDDPKSTGIVKVMERSTHFVVFFEQETSRGDLAEIQHYGEMIRRMCLQRGYGNVVVVKRDEHVKVPLTFADKPFVIYDDDAENAPPTQKLTETQIQSLKGLLKKLVENRTPNNTKQ